VARDSPTARELLATLALEPGPTAAAAAAGDPRRRFKRPLLIALAALSVLGPVERQFNVIPFMH
jgi:hypothetical protein